MNSRRGSALLASLWATSALATVAILQATRLSLELKWAGRLEEVQQARMLAWRGVEMAATLLMEKERVPQETWVSEDETLRYTISDEQGRIPLNSAPAEVLARLPGFTPLAVTELQARRQEEKRISHLGELPALAGFQSDRLSDLEPMVTVAQAGSVNLNSGSAAVLAALGLSSGLAEQIAGSRDDEPFEDAAQIPAELEKRYGPLLPEDQALLARLISSQRLGVRSSFFRVEVEARSARHGVRKKVTVLLERSSPEVRPLIRGWHEDP